MLRVRPLASVSAGVALLAAMAGGSEAQQVGTAGAVNPAAQASGRVLNVGGNILFKERISTTAAGSVQVIFVDKTTLNIGPNSDMVIDEFVYNPNTKSGKMTATLTKGVLRVVGGNVTHTEGATVKTPVASVGVRGGVATISHSQQTGTQAINHFGRLEVSSGNSTETIRRPGFAVQVTTAQAAPSAPARTTAPAIAAAVQATTSKPGQSGGAAARPTDAAATSAGVGQTSAALTPATIASVQGQTASQTIQFATEVVPATVAAIATVQQVTTQGSQAASVAATIPTPAFYSMHTSGVPFLPSAFLMPGFVVSEFYGYRRGGTSGTGEGRYSSATMIAGFAVNGQGAAQTSSFFVMTASFTDILGRSNQFHDAGFTAFARTNSSFGAPGRAAGNADSIAGTELFNSDFLPTSATLSNNNRVSVTGETQSQTSSYFLGNGTGTQQYSWSSSFAQSSLPSGTGQERSGVPLYGGIAGPMRTFHASTVNAIDSGVGRSFNVSGGIVIAFDTDRPRIQANAYIQREDNPSGDSRQFSSGIIQAGSLVAPRGRGVFIDDTRFVARAAVSDPLTTENPSQQISTTNGQTLVRSNQAFANQELVNGAATVAALSPGVTPCVCEYTRWGAWSMDNARDNGDGSEERDRMSVGWWVAGRFSDPAAFPTVGTATYNGHLIGSVKNSLTPAEYIAAGGFQYSANFGNPAASTMTVTNFDGANYGGTVPFDKTKNTVANFSQGLAGGPAISGVLPQTGGVPLTGANMNVGGFFYQGKSDPVKDVGGTFSVRANSTATPAGTNYNYIASGIFAGSR